MHEEKIFPKWFTNTLIAVGVLSLIQEFDRPTSFVFDLFFALSYPALLLVILFLLKEKVRSAEANIF